MFPDGTARDPEIALIDEHWQYLAAVAWAGYEAHGRGAVVIDEEAQANDLAEVRYVPGPIWPGDESVVENYDPNSEIIVVFLHGEQGWHLHQVAALPPPPVAVAMHPVERSFPQ